MHLLNASPVLHYMINPAWI